MSSNITRGLQVGLLFGVVLLTVDLLGFSTTVSGVLLPLILLGVWCGASVARKDTDSKAVFTKAIVAALTGGLIIAIFVFLIGSALAAKVDLRRELYELSPNAIRDLTFEQPPLLAALINLGIFAGATLVGALIWFNSGTYGWGSSISKTLSNLRTSFTNLPAWQWLTNTTVGKIVGIGLLIAIVGALPQVIPGILTYYTISTVLIYVLMALGLNIVVGLAGLLDLGYVVFFAIGAYTAALLTAPTPHNLLWNYWLVIPIGVALAALFGVLLGVPVLRLRGDYLAIVTLGFGEVIRVMMRSDALSAFSNGPKGVNSIGQPLLLGQKFNSPEAFVLLSAIGVAIVIFLTDRLQHSRVGRAWVAIREDETVAQQMGINTLFYKLLAFGIGASFAALGGLLYASRNQFTGPEDHTLLVSINILSIVIVGGMGSIPGVILGAFVLKGVPEILRELENYRILIFAALLVMMMIWRPQGLWPSARRRLEMKKDDVPLDELEAPVTEGVAK
jgi:branched-chain amino acid transport system permease protein